MEPATEALARRAAPRIDAVAPERSFYELRRLLASDDPVGGIGLADSTGLLAHLLPELDRLKGVEQNPYHHLDVWGHTLEVLERLVEIEREPDAVFGELGERIGAELRRPLADELTRGHALRLGALLHDAGKPATRAVTPEGRVLFWGHDGVGAGMAREVVRRFHGSTALARLRRGAGAASSAPRLPRARAPTEPPARVPLHACVRAGGAGGDGALRRRPAGHPRAANAHRGRGGSPGAGPRVGRRGRRMAGPPTLAPGAGRRVDRRAGDRAGPRGRAAAPDRRGGGLRGRGAHARGGAGRGSSGCYASPASARRGA